MWKIENKQIKMNKDDYGVPLKFKFTNVINTNITIAIYQGEEVKITKTYANLAVNYVEFSLTQEDTNNLDEGKYRYKVYQSGSTLKNTLLIDGIFIVEKGA